MTGSQLKRLKASLREQGIIGPQKSKKQKKAQQDDRAKGNKRLEKRAALQGIREQFNPFDLKHNARGPKHQVSTDRPSNAAKGILGRPAEARAAGEERRKQTLLKEMQMRHKVGGLDDRRIGEHDPNMTPEEAMMERFVREKQRSHKGNVFDLEDDNDAGASFSLTHGGKSLSFDGPDLRDDFDENEVEPGSDTEDEGKRAYLKRKHLADAAEAEEETDSKRPKTKQEIYKEIIAKSKLAKLERQEAKEADEDLIDELNKEMPNLRALLMTKGKPTLPQVQVASADGKQAESDKEFDRRVKALAMDRKAQPADRTKTDEEKTEERAEKLKELEERRVKRMRGEESESESEADAQEPEEPSNHAIQFMETEEDDFGLGKGIKTRPKASELGFDDEDDFFIEDDLVASGSEASPDENDESGEEDDESEEDDEDIAADEDEDDEFTKGLLTEEEAKNPIFKVGSSDSAKDKGDSDGIPYVFPCPQTHDEFLDIVGNIPSDKLAMVIRRIRALYHPQLDSGNKSKLATFSKVLIQHLVYLSSVPELPPFGVLEDLIRHIHSLAKTYAIEIGEEFREHIDDVGGNRPLALEFQDVTLLTAIGTIFPTSDHFHQVVTPAMLIIARYLGQKVPQSPNDYAKGVYLAVLMLQYQKLSKNFCPELMNFTLNTLVALSPIKPNWTSVFPLHEPPSGMRVKGAKSVKVRKLSYLDCSAKSNSSADKIAESKIAIIDTTIKTLDAAMEIWMGKSSFIETFNPFATVLAHLGTCHIELPKALMDNITKTKQKVDRLLRAATLSRRTVELHHHRPLPIKMNIPKFEDKFDPNKHYDPDSERAQLNKLKAEHKKERKGAMRELRKDAHFMAREKLRVKKAKDAAYDKKFKRLVAEIQGEEGREANAYAREKEQRKRAAKQR